MAIIKADAYGHGLLPLAQAALGAGADWLGVAQLAEAFELRVGLDNAGIAAGFQARAERRQGNPSISEAECATLASLGAWVHAQAAFRAGVGSQGHVHPIQAIDIARALPEIIGELCS